MQARVTAILVAHSGAAYLERTLSGLSAQTRPPDSVIAVDVASADGSADLLAAAGPAQLVAAPGRTTFGGAISHAMRVAAPAAADNEWLWLLAHDNAPDPAALEQLLGAVEIAPSVAVAGPKLMRWDQPDVIAEFGETITRFGASINLVEGELDQAQHDVQDDVLGVAAGGMLVRRSVWAALGGFDPGLPSVDASLDFSIRARLAGYRVVVVPGAKVASIGGPEQFGRRSVSAGRRARIARTAQLHRRLAYAPGAAVPVHWLSLVPLAILRSIGQLAAKRPGAIGGELSSAFAVAFGRTGVGAARRALRSARRLGWASVAPLRMPPAEVRERRGQAREQLRQPVVVTQDSTRAGFVAHGGLWVVLLAAAVGAIVFGPVLGASGLTGGTLAPLSGTVQELWSHVGYGWRDIGTGFVGAADPFASVLAVLGSLTFWSPSTSLVLLSVLAMPLAALGAWFAARRITERPWLPAVAALLWAVAPPLLGSVTSGHLGATIAHLLLPWLLLTGLSSARSWASAAGAALLFAATAASAPLLVPALVLCWLALMAARPKSIHRSIWIPVPAIALFAPLVVQQVVRGNPLGLLAEPGVPVGGAEVSGLHLALAAPGSGLHGWSAALEPFALGTSAPLIVVAALLAPIGILALAALFVPGSRRAIPAMLIAFLGYVSAVAAVHVQVASVGPTAVPLWPGAALSLFWLGIVASLLVGLDALGRASIPLAALTGVVSVLVVVPLLGVVYSGTATVQPAGRILPAVVTAEAQDDQGVGTLVLTPEPEGRLSATLERGTGTTLDDQSTLAATATGISPAERRLATLAGNLASHSGYDAGTELRRLGVGFVVLTPSQENAAVRQRASDALDSNPLFSPVGSTANGLLWRYDDLPDGATTTEHASNTGTPLGLGILIGQGIVFGLTLLLGIPTVGRRKRATVSGSVAGEPVDTFDEDDHV
ncbi:MAG TPA: glycosyltransferase family 2 protein [Lacisediminihabitans sp.]|uniref:glycosyltransferase family 2 protein n=1 Tax=Lacisediminihabitans sp. TaxID=2787631 RepID=UPI002EDB7B07